MEVRPVTEDELDAVLPLVAGYQRFYGNDAPDDARNRAFFGTFIAPSDRGLLLAAWDGQAAVGFACLHFTPDSIGAREGVVMEDLFVADGRRGAGAGEALIAAAADAARSRGAETLDWMTALDNRRAQRLYERVGAERSAWLQYELPLGSGR